MNPYRWTTEEAHFNNTETMSDFINYGIDNVFGELLHVNETYAEIDVDGVRYACHAAGDGDSFNHIVTFELL